MYTSRINGRSFNRIFNPVRPEEGVASKLTDPLTLDIPDKELAEIVDTKIKESRDFFKTRYNLYDRRAKMELYLFGRQLTSRERDGEMKDYEARSLDNVLYEIEADIKPLAMSQLPDMIVLPGENTTDKRIVAKEVSMAIDSSLKSRNNRVVLGKAFKHLPVYLTGIIKVRWNPALNNGLGDYVFEVIHPDNIDIDPYCTTNNADDMEWIAQSVPMTVHDVLKTYPKAKDEFIKELQSTGVALDPVQVWKNLDTQIRISEVWFTWDEEADNGEYRRVEGVIWKYEKCILGKIRNPNFDYEGKESLFTFDKPDDPTSKRQLTLAEMQWALTTGQFPLKVEAEQMYYNYHESPKKPYFFMGYDQWGKVAYDETSRIEQNLHLQETLDRRSKQINETMNDVGHFIWGKESGFTDEEVELMDKTNPEQDYVVDGDPKESYAFVEAERPSQEEFEYQNTIIERMHTIAGSNAIRGNMVPNTTATGNQIDREANFTRADDLVEDTINAAAEWMASYSLQFIKLRYTADHWRKILGARGDVIFIKLNRDMIDDGMEVKIKASGTDKIKKQNNAADAARMNMIDPLNFNRDMNYDDFAERTRDLVVWLQASKSGNITPYLQTVVGEFLEQDPVLNNILKQITQPMPSTSETDPANSVLNQPTPNPMQQQGQPTGQPGPAQPQNPTPQNTGAVPTQPPPGPPQGSPRAA